MSADNKASFDTSAPLDSNKNMQKFTSTSTVEGYNYKLKDNEYANIDFSNCKLNFFNNNANDIIQLCFKKIADENMNLDETKVRNCMTKVKMSYNL
jgi:hypothetical protein